MGETLGSAFVRCRRGVVLLGNLGSHADLGGELLLGQLEVGENPV